MFCPKCNMLTSAIFVATRTMRGSSQLTENLCDIVKMPGMRNSCLYRHKFVNKAVSPGAECVTHAGERVTVFLVNRADKHIFVELISWCGFQLLGCDTCRSAILKKLRALVNNNATLRYFHSGVADTVSRCY